MAFQWTIDVPRKLALVTLSGSVTGPQIAEIIVSVYEDPAWQPGFDILYDCRAITELLLEKTDQAGFVQQQRQYAAIAGQGVDVIIVSRTLDKAMAQIYAGLAKDELRKTHVCSSEEEAWRILGLQRADIS